MVDDGTCDVSSNGFVAGLSVRDGRRKVAALRGCVFRVVVSENVTYGKGAVTPRSPREVTCATCDSPRVQWSGGPGVAWPSP